MCLKGYPGRVAGERTPSVVADHDHDSRPATTARPSTNPSVSRPVTNQEASVPAPVLASTS